MPFKTSGIGSPAALALVAILAIGAGAAAYVITQQARKLPVGIAKANGRIEVERVDVATKYAGRIAEIRVKEGDFVEAGSLVAQLDVAELKAQLGAASAGVRRAGEVISRAEAEVALRVAEHKLSVLELQRATQLEKKKFASTADLDRRTAQQAIAEANELAARATVRDARAAREAAEAQVTLLEATIAEMSLRAPVTGRIEHKLVQTGAVIGAGARVATILDVSDVHMTIFLPTTQSGRVALGSDARIALDASSTTIIPATISFVAAEAQFTPKTVETANEREKLMYRVKLKIDPALLEKYRDYVKAGLTGDAYVKIGTSADWPRTLAARLPDG